MNRRPLGFVSIGLGLIVWAVGFEGNAAIADIAFRKPSALGEGFLETIPLTLAEGLPEVDQAVLETLGALVNAERQRAGLAPLTLSSPLSVAAQRHAQDMADHNRLSHTGSDGSTMQTRVEAADYSWRTLGENVAMGQPTPEAVMVAWMNSPGHRQNILNPAFTELGLGYAESAAGSPYWVQVFAKPM